MDIPPDLQSLTAEVEALRAENRRLNEELGDMGILYQNTIEHGEAVEDQLAEKNIELNRTKERLDQELAEACNYVRSMLPPPRQDLPRTEWLLIPSTELGGDSFGYHWIDDDHFALYLLDVCGHGVGAALLSVTAINVLRSASLPNTDFREPGTLLSALNEAFQMETQNNMYFTIWYGVYQVSTRLLRYASAGHPPAILLREKAGASEATLLQVKGMVLGGMPGTVYREESVTIESGDRLFLLSDGTYEVEKPDGVRLEFGEFVQFAAQGAGSGSELERILDWVRSMSGAGPLDDDFTLLKVVF
ncbi:MAG: PP2C family protein-serine/threonine phosphatase [Chthoniobacter sp.]|uniref:PP2C family protein-serine/threonine phosphatase n=1 Tax=Chthoniobacter sp. TaxID=2510640 RepID=UPI0032A7C842